MGKLLILSISKNEEYILDKLEEILAAEPSIKRIPLPVRQSVLSFPELEIDLRTQTVRWKGRLLQLTHLEFFTLAYLAQHPSWVFTKEQIYEAVWNEPGDACGASVASVISQLRRKLWPENPLGGYIKTVHNSGYKFEPK